MTRPLTILCLLTLLILTTVPSAVGGGFSSDGAWWTNGTWPSGIGALASNTVDHLTYGVVIGADTNLWLDRNLGASQVATSITDTSSYGYLYQWGRLSDGHQISTSGTTGTQSTGDVPGNANFIVGSEDWRATQNDTLWQNGTNNPCPPGFHVPAQTEWATLIDDAGINNDTTAYGSTLPTCGRPCLW